MGKHPVITAPLLFHENQRCTSFSLSFAPSPFQKQTVSSFISAGLQYCSIQCKIWPLANSIGFRNVNHLDSDNESHSSITIRAAGLFCSLYSFFLFYCISAPFTDSYMKLSRSSTCSPTQAYACPCFLSHNPHLASRSAYDPIASGTNHLKVKGHAVMSLLNVQWKKEM